MGFIQIIDWRKCYKGGLNKLYMWKYLPGCLNAVKILYSQCNPWPFTLCRYGPISFGFGISPKLVAMEHVIPDIPASHVLPLFYPSYLFLKQWLVVKFKIYNIMISILVCWGCENANKRMVLLHYLPVSLYAVKWHFVIKPL